MSQESKTQRELVQNFAEFLTYLEKEAPISTEQQLEDLGFDPKMIADSGEKLAKSILDKQLQEERNAIHKARLAAESKFLSKPKKCSMTREEVENAILEILSGNMGKEAQVRAAAFFKDFKSATIEDKISLLEDIEILKSFSEKDSENK